MHHNLGSMRQSSIPSEWAHAVRRYFLHSWPKLCWLAFDGPACFGVVVCKADDHRGSLRGYIAMLVVQNSYRGLGVGEQQPESALGAYLHACLQGCLSGSIHPFPVPRSGGQAGWLLGAVCI